MFTENEVVDYVVDWLKLNGCHIDSTCHDTQRGDDVAATLPDGTQLFVECKGAISRKHGGKLDDWQSSAMAVFGATLVFESFNIFFYMAFHVNYNFLSTFLSTILPLAFYNALFAPFIYYLVLKMERWMDERA